MLGSPSMTSAKRQRAEAPVHLKRPHYDLLDQRLGHRVPARNQLRRDLDDRRARRGVRSDAPPPAARDGPRTRRRARGAVDRRPRRRRPSVGGLIRDDRAAPAPPAVASMIERHAWAGYLAVA